MTSKDVKNTLDDLICIVEEIKWYKDMPEIFMNDLERDLSNVAKDLLAINGYQVWNEK